MKRKVKPLALRRAGPLAESAKSKIKSHRNQRATGEGEKKGVENQGWWPASVTMEIRSWMLPVEGGKRSP